MQKAKKRLQFDCFWGQVLPDFCLKFLVAPALIIAIIALLLRDIWPPMQVFFSFLALLLLIFFSLSLGVVINLEFKNKILLITCGLFYLLAVVMLIFHFDSRVFSAFDLFLAFIVPVYIYIGGQFGKILKKH